MERHYLLKRLVSLPVIWASIAMVHVSILMLMPGDAIATLASTADPMFQQPFNYSVPSLATVLMQLLQGHLGHSIFLQQPVSQLILSHLRPTLILTLMAFVPLYGLGLVLGWFLQRGHVWAKIIHQLCTAMAALPSCLIYTLVFVLQYQLFREPLSHTYLYGAGFLALRRIAPLANLVSHCLSTTIDAPYIHMARRRGVAPIKIATVYILKNALIPVWVRLPKHFAQVLFAGTLTIEVLFSIPGLGRLTFTALKHYDYPLIMGCLMASCMCLSLCYLTGDVIAQWLSPKMTIGGS
ncbi:ABC transporter permease [Candidatus Synchoanobacter obligatus]|uniref:ABC transporter permease n=1 Tax=Candidatus Synchoanobacter obligatus TaxID=2919597 RepID=A0ABT1L4Z8_9GAMM|nr:ABC transporter permease [Candidatus Synchoanobacter obligatus]MCP8352254.1 ABC transporter permease [Candidatus Synchoanobacter obligatus]